MFVTFSHVATKVVGTKLNQFLPDRYARQTPTNTTKNAPCSTIFTTMCHKFSTL